MRMETARLKFVKPNGKPIDHELLINVNLIKHSFPFGIGMGQSWALFEQKNFARYRIYKGDVFNLVALGFQWSWMEQKRDQIKRVEHIESNLKLGTI